MSGETISTEKTGVTGTVGKAPPGYRFIPGSKELEIIPGGPQDFKYQAAYSQAQQKVDTVKTSLDRLDDAAGKLLKSPGLNGIVGIQGMFPNVPGWAAADAKALLENIKTQVGINALQAMRDASKTGGALGQVSDFENKMLQNSLYSLEQSQSLEQMKLALKDIQKFSQGASGRLDKAFNSTFGDKKTGTVTPSISKEDAIAELKRRGKL
jgi:hypothetical protein